MEFLMVRSRSGCLFLLVVFLASMQAALAQESARTVPLNLADMTRRAATIVHGHVVEAHLESDRALRGATTMVVTLRADEWLKGQAAPTFTFRQFVGDIRARYGSLPYRKGSEVVLFMTAPSRYGLSSPVGLEQSRFEVVRRGGQAFVVNGHGNAGLLRGMQADAQQRKMRLSARTSGLLARAPRGPLALDDFKTLTREFAGSR
jgi:hypothetical protein